jgi:hydrogenase expression/formation protein HypC
MCLAVPGRVVEIRETAGSGPGPVGVVDFQGSRVEANLAMTPGVGVGDWVLVHAGFAICALDEDEARQTWDYLQEAEVAECGGEFPGGADADSPGARAGRS